MVLANTPPAGAGKVQRVTKTDMLLAHIDGLGVDKFMNPIGVRTLALAEATGVPVNSISALLAPHVASGRLCTCKVTVPGSPAQNEYRKGAGAVTPDFKPLDTRRAGVALRTPARATTPAASLSTPRPGLNAIEPPTLGKPQPAVGNTGSTRSESSTILTEARAVTADEATPKPAPDVRLKKEPAAAKASAGDAVELPKLSIDQDGRLQIGDADDPAQWVFSPEQTLAIGDFLHATQGVWRA